jgi:hypothetical protein
MLAAELMERIATGVSTQPVAGHALIFEDQYISTGGQMIELIRGHDRFCCDLRPLFYDILERRGGVAVTRGLECHPYDIAGLLVAQQAGVIITNGFGQPLDAKFGVDEGIHWCGYANANLQREIQPIIQSWLGEQGLRSE